MGSGTALNPFGLLKGNYCWQNIHLWCSFRWVCFRCTLRWRGNPIQVGMKPPIFFGKSIIVYVDFWVAVAQQFGDSLMRCHAIFSTQTWLWKKLSPKEPQWPEERVIPQEETGQARNPSCWKGLENVEESVEVSKNTKTPLMVKERFGATTRYSARILESRICNNLRKRLNKKTWNIQQYPRDNSVKSI